MQVLRRLLSLAYILAYLNNCGCIPVGSDEFQPRLFGRCVDVPEAISTLHYYIIDKIPLERRCKRYAVLSALFKENSRPSRLDILKLSELDDDVLDHRKIDVEDLMAFYMAAIDGYRSSTLAPPIFDLVDCLRDINLPQAAMYLQCPELVLTLNVYREVLNSPESKINLDQVNLRQFNPAFLTIFKLHFKENFQEDHSPEIYNAPADVNTSRAEPSESLKQRQQDEVRISFEEDLSRLSGQERYERRRAQQRQRQRKSRLEKPHRHREQERLRKRRNRILHPSVAREKGRIWEQRRRDRIKDRQMEERLLRRERIAGLQREQQRQSPIFHQDMLTPSPISAPMPTLAESAQLQQPHTDMPDTGNLWQPPISSGPLPIGHSLNNDQSSLYQQQLENIPGTSYELPFVQQPTRSCPTQHDLASVTSSSPYYLHDHIHIPEQGEVMNQRTEDLVDSRLYQIEDQGQPYNYIIDNEMIDESLMSLLATFNPDIRSSQFDDVNAIVGAFSGDSQDIAESSSNKMDKTNYSQPQNEPKDRNGG